MFSKALERLPREISVGVCRHNGAEFRHKEAYESLVEEVWGSFNWEIRRGDRTQMVEFETTGGKGNMPTGSLLVCETTTHEQVWSLATPLKARAVASAFGKTFPPTRPPIAQDWVSEQTFRQLIGFGCVAHLVMMVSRPTAVGFVFGIVAVIALAANNVTEE